jgi:hypothetical protein
MWSGGWILRGVCPRWSTCPPGFFPLLSRRLLGGDFTLPTDTEEEYMTATIVLKTGKHLLNSGRDHHNSSNFHQVVKARNRCLQRIPGFVLIPHSQAVFRHPCRERIGT